MSRSSLTKSVSPPARGGAETAGAAPTRGRQATRANPSTVIAILTSLSNVLPFSGERRTDARSYHGREEPRAPARGVAARPPLERTAQAFIRCNGLLDGTAVQITPARDNTN